jgi:hypothetical protein
LCICDANQRNLRRGELVLKTGSAARFEVWRIRV